MGILIFWLHYIIAGILLYLILKCIYIKGKEEKKWDIVIYYKTNDDKRLKHPLWSIILFLFVFIIPVLNIITFIIYLLVMTINMEGNDKCRYYCKSIFNKEY